MISTTQDKYYHIGSYFGVALVTLNFILKLKQPFILNNNGVGCEELQCRRRLRKAATLVARDKRAGEEIPMAQNFWCLEGHLYISLHPLNLIYSLCQELPCILGLVKVKLYKL
jgi:hypothetical protein